MTKSTPLPGHKVRGSDTGRPVMAVLDLLGRRWTLRILWELRSGPRTFRELQSACDGASPSVINTRLRELRKAQLVIHNTGEGYRLSTQGIELSEYLEPLAEWSNEWGKRLDNEQQG